MSHRAERLTSARPWPCAVIVTTRESPSTLGVTRATGACAIGADLATRAIGRAAAHGTDVASAPAALGPRAALGVRGALGTDAARANEAVALRGGHHGPRRRAAITGLTASVAADLAAAAVGGTRAGRARVRRAHFPGTALGVKAAGAIHASPTAALLPSATLRVARARTAEPRGVARRTGSTISARAAVARLASPAAAHAPGAALSVAGTTRATATRTHLT